MDDNICDVQVDRSVYSYLMESTGFRVAAR